ncbi:NAD(P)-dependent oxidoreductase [Streptomyces sp. NPDC015350]|uniref:NAD(P)-dependent oxidoreductase n=1 Tax=Streptomyces sp. NPDC015350 TaxID=3364955 RepID=UPI0036F6DB7D
MTANGAACPFALVLTGAADPTLLARALPGWTVILADSLDQAAELPDPSAVRILVVPSGVPVGPAELDRLPGLSDVIRTGAGLDGLDLTALAARRIRVHRNPAPAGAAVAEWVLAAALSLARRIPLGHAALTSGIHLKASCLTPPLNRARVAIWGAGPVGRACARALTLHVGEIVYAARPSIEPGLPQMPAAQLSAWADLHINALPHTPKTHHTFGAEFLARARERHPLLIVAGGLDTVDLTACIEALDNGHLDGLAFDLVDHTGTLLPRGGIPRNLLVTPHIGAQRTDVRVALDRWAADLARTLAHTDEEGSEAA